MEHIIDPKFFCCKKLTFAVPCYNHENYISECLDSILAQELNVPFDILVCDNGSTDNSSNVLREYLRKYPDKIKVIFLGKNGGVTHAYNTLFNHIKSEYFHIVDSDDYLLGTHFVQKGLDFLESHRDFLVYAGNEVNFKNGSFCGHHFSKIFLGLSYSWSDVYKLPCSHFEPQTSSILFRNFVVFDAVKKEYLRAEKSGDRFWFDAFAGETIFFYQYLLFGKAFLSKDNVAVRRMLNSSVCSSLSPVSFRVASALGCLIYICHNILPEYRKFFESLFFWQYSRGLKLIYKNRANPNYLRQEDCDSLKEIYHLLPTADFVWSKLKWHSSILVRCFYKARTCAWLLCRQMYRILSRKRIV